MATEVVSFEAQREFPRFTISSTKPVRVDLGPAGSGQVLDISQGGIRVKSVAPLRRDTEIPICLYIPETSGSLRCTGRVIWSKPTGAAGLKFKDLSEEQRAVLVQWLEELRNTSSGEKPAAVDEFVRVTGQIAAMKLNNADALGLVVRRATQLATANGVAIALGKPENMICLGRGGNAPELGSVISPTVGLTGECVRGRKPALCDDASVDPRGADLKQGSALILPLLVNGELRGVMQVFSAQPRAFDAKCIENMEKLADAVVYVAHNVMPQRRLATVTQMPKPAPTPTSARPVAAESKVTPIATRPLSAPPVSKPSDSGRIGAFTGPVVKLPVIPTPHRPASEMPPAPVETPQAATENALAAPVELEPLAGSVDDNTLAVAHREPLRRPERSSSAPLATYHVQTPKKPVWLYAAPVAVVLAIAAGAVYWSHHRAQPAPATVAATSAPVVTQAAVAAPSPSPEENARVTTPAAPAVPPTPTAAPAKTRAAEPMEVIEAAEKKTAPTEVAKPEPEAMIIASGAPVPRPAKVDDSEVAAPSATGIGTHSALPGIAMPAPIPTPKLVNARSSTLTGGNLIDRVPPVYPSAARLNHLEGKVEVMAVITTAGTVDRVRKVSGNQILVQATVDAVKRWRYEPFKLDGQPIEKEISIEVNFKVPN